jgi:hypothetical protein
MQQIEELLETVKSVAVAPDVSADEALYASLLVESSELDEIYQKLTSTLEKDHQSLFEAMKDNLRSHHDSFADAAAAFAKKPGLAGAFRRLSQRTDKL